jgi:hypothetical protein
VARRRGRTGFAGAGRALSPFSGRFPAGRRDGVGAPDRALSPFSGRFGPADGAGGPSGWWP